MSVSMTKSDGVTIVTLNSDTRSACPPLCQILQALCYSPVCCSVSQKLRSLQGTTLSALGTVQVMVGLMNIALGAILCYTYVARSWVLRYNNAHIWLGALFIIFGILCILSEKFPSPCLVVSSVSAQLAGIAFSITGVVVYSCNLADLSFWVMCDDYYNYNYGGWGGTSPAPNPARQPDLEKCLEGKTIIQVVLGGVNVLLIVLSVLQLCVSISCVVLGIRAVRKDFKKENQSEDLGHYTPLLKP